MVNTGDVKKPSDLTSALCVGWSGSETPPPTTRREITRHVALQNVMQNSKEHSTHCGGEGSHLIPLHIFHFFLSPAQVTSAHSNLP